MPATGGEETKSLQGFNEDMPRPWSNRQFAEMIVMVKDENGKGTMCRALLDSGCSRTIILKQFTNTKN